jgi:hypothetical protein
MKKILKTPKILNLIVFYSIEKSYHEYSIKSMALENSISEIYPLSLIFENRFFKKYNLNMLKIFKYKTDLISTFGDKTSFLIHIFFFDQLFKNLEKVLTPILNFLKKSKLTSYMDFKLLKNSMIKILKNNSHKNLYFKENYEILKADYYFQMRMLVISFLISSRIFLFPNPNPKGNFPIISLGTIFNLLQILAFKLNGLYFSKFKTSLDLRSKELKFFNKNDFNSKILEYHDLLFEKTDKFLKNQFNGIQNRHYCKKFFRKRHLFELILNFKKLDLGGLGKLQKSNFNQKMISFEILNSKTWLALQKKIINFKIKSNVDLAAYLVAIN